jgi:hypothetical protein
MVEQGVEPSPPVEVEEQEEYKVCNVEDRRLSRWQLKDLIRMTRYEFCTWEPAMFVDGLQAVDISKQYNGLEVITKQLTNSEQPH